MKIEYQTANVDQVSFPAGSKPTIIYKSGELDRMFDQAELALAATGRVYNKGGALVSLTDDGKTFPLTQPSVLILLARAADWVKKMRGDDGEVRSKRVDPPVPVAAALPRCVEWKTMPELRQVVDHPLFLTESKCLLAQGYDQKSKFFGNFRPLESVDLQSSKADAEKAAGEILSLFATLDLETESDLSAVLCAALTAVSRAALKTAPLFLITAPVIGSGKGMVARLLARFAQAGEPPSKTLQSDDDEIKKELISALLTGAAVLFFDEVKGGEIDSVPLRTLATSETFGGRLLGTNTNLELSTRALVLITGNNVTPSADTSRRMLEIRLNPHCESPAVRNFKTDPIQHFDAHRYTFIRAALTIQAAYLKFLQSGGPIPEAPGIGSFTDWNEWCRLPVLWLTGNDPATRLLNQLKFDPAKVELGEVLSEWNREFGDKAVTASEVCKSPKLYEAIKSVAGARNRDLSTIDVGRWIAKQRDRVVAGRMLEKSDSITNVSKWRVV